MANSLAGDEAFAFLLLAMGASLLRGHSARREASLAEVVTGGLSLDDGGALILRVMRATSSGWRMEESVLFSTSCLTNGVDT